MGGWGGEGACSRNAGHSVGLRHGGGQGNHERPAVGLVEGGGRRKARHKRRPGGLAPGGAAQQQLVQPHQPVRLHDLRLPPGHSSGETPPENAGSAEIRVVLHGAAAAAQAVLEAECHGDRCAVSL